jgi:AcrR family transcriptional regulator
MRITAQAKADTRRRILQAAADLFAENGFAATTTRDLSRSVKLAAGTLFNYFSTKEEIVAALAAEATAAAHAEWDSLAPSPATLSERLFALVACELRQLRPLRGFLAPALDLNPWPQPAATASDSHSATPNNDFRAAHLAIVQQSLFDTLCDEPGAVAMQLYFTLYTGVLTAWTHDESPYQEDTLALLDQSLAMFTTWLTTSRGIRAESPSDTSSTIVQ